MIVASRRTIWQEGAAAALALLAAACGAVSSGAPADGRAPGAAAAATVRAAPLAEATLEHPKLVVQLTGVARTAEGFLTVSWRVVNPDPVAPATMASAFAAAAGDEGSMADACLFDEAHRKKYFVLRDDQGRAACSREAGAIPAGGDRAAWCRFAGPPESVGAIAVSVPGLPMFRDVPISAAGLRRGR